MLTPAEQVVEAGVIVVAEVGLDAGDVSGLAGLAVEGVGAVLVVVVVAGRDLGAGGVAVAVGVVDLRVDARHEVPCRVHDAVAPARGDVEAVDLEGPVPLDEVAREHLEVAVHDGAQAADHDAAHGVARVGVRVPQGVGDADGVEVEHLLEVAGEVGAVGAVGEVVGAALDWQGGPSLSKCPMMASRWGMEVAKW